LAEKISREKSVAHPGTLEIFIQPAICALGFTFKLLFVSLHLAALPILGNGVCSCGFPMQSRPIRTSRQRFVNDPSGISLIGSKKKGRNYPPHLHIERCGNGATSGRYMVLITGLMHSLW
jgi:hypothetical protein